MTLKNNSKNNTIAVKLKKASSLLDRLTGLIPLKEMPDQYALWIPQCNSIHSFFMNFEFDAIFIDKHMKVKKCYSNVKPNRLVLPVFGAKDVVELNSGSIEKYNIQVGDQLYVVD